MGSLREWGDIAGLMANFIRDSGLMGSNMVQGSGKGLKGIHMPVNGSLERQMAMEFIPGSMETVTKVNSDNA